jgi:hypothetical protein
MLRAEDSRISSTLKYLGSGLIEFTYILLDPELDTAET